MNNVKISKDNKTLKKIIGGQKLRLVTSINAYWFIHDKCKLCECMLVLAQGRLIRGSHSRDSPQFLTLTPYSPRGSSRRLNAILF